MVADLEKTKPTSQTEREEKLTNKITTDFENNMNNDLDVKSAFDSLYETTAKLHKIRHSLGIQDIKNVLDNLRRVDRVLQCILKGD
jgi:uncharacterized protein (DUF2235 family)